MDDDDISNDLAWAVFIVSCFVCGALGHYLWVAR